MTIGADLIFTGVGAMIIALITGAVTVYNSRNKRAILLKEIDIYKAWKNEAQGDTEIEAVEKLRESVSHQISLITPKEKTDDKRSHLPIDLPIIIGCIVTIALNIVIVLNFETSLAITLTIFVVSAYALFTAVFLVIQQYRKNKKHVASFSEWEYRSAQEGREASDN